MNKLIIGLTAFTLLLSACGSSGGDTPSQPEPVDTVSGTLPGVTEASTAYLGTGFESNADGSGALYEPYYPIEVAANGSFSFELPTPPDGDLFEFSCPGDSASARGVEIGTITLADDLPEVESDIKGEYYYGSEADFEAAEGDGYIVLWLYSDRPYSFEGYCEDFLGDTDLDLAEGWNTVTVYLGSSRSGPPPADAAWRLD